MDHLLEKIARPFLPLVERISTKNVQASALLWSGSQPLTWSSVNWNSVNWNSVNWNSVNWNSVNWNSVNWNSDYWGSTGSNLLSTMADESQVNEQTNPVKTETEVVEPPTEVTADELDLIPSMMGDLTPAFSGGMSDLFTIDQLMVPALDLDVPLALPPLGNPLQLVEPGPVDIYSTSVSSIQEIQQLLRTGGSFPAATSVGTIASDASLMAAASICRPALSR